MPAKEELRSLVATLSDAEAAELLEYAHWLREESETLTPDELARVREDKSRSSAAPTSPLMLSNATGLDPVSWTL
jgi:hypothetical protein